MPRRDTAFLFDRLGDRPRFEEMVEFITLNILPALRSNEMDHFPIGDKLFLIRCYFIALSQIDDYDMAWVLVVSPLNPRDK